MRATGLAEDVEVQIVLVNLPVGLFEAIGAAGDPRRWKNALLDAGSCGGEQGSRNEDKQFSQDQNS